MKREKSESGGVNVKRNESKLRESKCKKWMAKQIKVYRRINVVEIKLTGTKLN